MSGRKRGNNKRQPRVSATGINTKCISIMPDGSAQFFTPKKREKQMQIQRNAAGEYEVVKRDRSLI